MYLLQPLGDGCDGRHATGERRQHVAVRTYGAAEVPLLHHATHTQLKQLSEMRYTF